MRRGFPSTAGFTFIELLVVLSLIGILSIAGLLNYQNWSGQAYDATAQLDYRSVKVGLGDLVSTPGAPNRVVIRRFRGPGALPSPLQNIRVSSNVEVSVNFQSRIQAGRLPTTSTVMTVEHLQGSFIYRYTEANGAVVEQVVKKN